MKKFNLEEFNVAGNKFHQIEAIFNFETGLTVDVDEYTVEKRSGITPWQGCDFIAFGASRTSKTFIEVSGIPTVNFVTARFKTVKIFAYSLPENLVENKARMVNSMVAQVEKYATEWSNDFDQLVKTLVNVKEKM